jgi:hypothetical protein
MTAPTIDRPSVAPGFTNLSCIRCGRPVPNGPASPMFWLHTHWMFVHGGIPWGAWES